jgi:TRAP-type mannitol/chloroaromatic compound transport system permease small subunit
VAPSEGAPHQGIVGRIERFVDRVGRASSWLALVIVALMSVNVVLRYLFSIGSVWSQELEWHLLVPLVLFGCSYALLHGEHVRVDIVYGRLSGSNKKRVDFASALLVIAIAALFIWFSLHYVQQAYTIDEGSPDPGGLPHRYLLKALLPVGFALLLLQGIAGALKSFRELKSHR